MIIHPLLLQVINWMSCMHFGIESELNNKGHFSATAIMLNHSHTIINIPYCPMNKCITATKTK